MSFQDTGGIFLVDKPAGPTSFAMVRGLRRVLGLKKVGHAGTLDPFASGLLILCAGRAATRLIPRFMHGEKEYLATLCLGVETTTLDPEGTVTNRCAVGRKDAVEIERVLAGFRGSQLQTPPAFSALKHKGKPLYHYARRGITIVKEPREVNIFVLERTDGEHDLVGDECLLRLRVVCSKGTYIRSLAADIGASLGCGAYLKELRRTRSGCFFLDGSLSGDVLRTGADRQQVLNAAMSVEDACNLLQ
ncbi:tRNA pseudouridine(55) synthase TruB [Desulfoprunum benzoelyticum]|nr:tRNA pseudouridine(55) synthase TruB [Desulfoprunum benzoelyticum]